MSARPLLHLTLFISLWVTACMPRPDSPPGLPQTTPTTMDKNTPELPPAALTTSTPITNDSLQKKITNLALADLGQRLTVDSKLIEIISVDPVTWPNAALGCPRPDKVYAQGIVPGFRIKLAAAGTEYIYHTDQTGTILLCPEAGSGNPDALTEPIYPKDTTGGQIP